MKKLCLIFTMAFLPTLGFCQLIGDSVIVYINNRVEVNLAVPDYDRLRSSDIEIATLKEFQDLIPQLESELSPESADLVNYSIGGPLTIEPGDPKRIYMNRDGELVNTGVRDKAVINGPDFKILITTTDLTQVADMPLINCLKTVIDSLPEKKNWSRSLYFECMNDEVNQLEALNNQVDFLEFNIGAGAGLYKNTLIPDLTMGLGIGFNRKGLVRYPYISTNILFSMETSPRKTYIDSFLNLGYGWNINKNNGKNEMVSVELGYLVLHAGNTFEGNTFKLGANWSPGKGIVVSPNIFYTHWNNDMFTGIRVGFGF